MKPVAPGDPIPTNSRTWNAILNAARANQNQISTLASPDGISRLPDLMIRNTTGATLPQFAPAAPDGVVIDPPKRNFLSTPAVEVVVPGFDELNAVVAAAPIEDGKIGPAWISGITPAEIDVIADTDSFVLMKDGENEWVSDAAQGWPIVYKESGTGKKWGYIILGPRSGGGEVVALCQAPEGGVPARTGQTPGVASCAIVILAPSAGDGYSQGDLVRVDESINIRNWTFNTAGDEGDRVIQVSGHYAGAWVVGWSCDNEGDPEDIKLFDPDYSPPPIEDPEPVEEPEEPEEVFEL